MECIDFKELFAQIPDTLEESAKIDGANEPTILYKIVLPLSNPYWRQLPFPRSGALE